MKGIVKWLRSLILVLLLLVGSYIAYVFLDYHRIPDYQALQIVQKGKDSELEAEKDYSIMTYNVGFGAYLPDFSFFMDGGKSSWAKSETSVQQTLDAIGEMVSKENPDFSLFQEVDLAGTRSYNVNQYGILQEHLKKQSSTFAVNYDSSFLFYPLGQPHGKNRSGLATFAKTGIKSAQRRSLPISNGFSKFFDLDRAYSAQRFAVENDKELVLINVHLSAYSQDKNVRNGQMKMLTDEMESAYAKGDYVIVGGDLNHDLEATEGENPGGRSWTVAFPRKVLGEHFSLAMDRLTDAQRLSLGHSARDANEAYQVGRTFTVTVDGFIISDNVAVTDYHLLKTGYAYSDHEPVEMRFYLKKD